MPIVRTAARALLGAPFVVLGSEAAAAPGGRVDLVAGVGIPAPEVAVRVNGAAMTVGGLALGLGVLPRVAAAGLALSLVPTTLPGHPFWKDDDPAARKTNRIQFLKNLGLLGGLVALLAAGEGAGHGRRRRSAGAGDNG